ncbi:armadillo-type protein [Radiomyces spectabilis]|uniref:armadillo-type protein n=1 Tax=Radiomyces spectabilis TaxID=64574 RepID=UPI0022209903|nr:armadillo-type protein [Radiomyces spectabilis]KAI8374572.1 armadillo-type protein [Radiomyces spectabilis]
MAESQEQTGEVTWPEFIKNRVTVTITKSSISDRLDFLHHALLIRLRRKDLPVDALPSLLSLVFLTYTRYHDRASRLAILEVLKELNNWNADIFQKAFVPALVREAEKIGKRTSTGECVTSAADRFILLTWVDLLIGLVLKSVDVEKAASSTLLSSLVNAQALLLDGFANDQKKTIAKSALVDVRRTVRQNATAIPTLLDIALANASTVTPSYRNAVLIGTIIDTSLRLKVNASSGKQYIDDAKSKLISYYLKNIVSSRTAVTTSAMDAFRDFMHFTVPEDTFVSECVPVFEKMMLRSPEVALPVLARIVPVLSFDVSDIFATKWLDPLLNHLRSTSVAVRQGGMMLWEALTEICRKQEALVKIVTATSKTLTGGKVTSWEHRAVLYNALSSLAQPADTVISHKALEGYFAMIPKESNEQAMTCAVDGVGRHLIVLIYDDAYSGAHKELVDKAVKVSSEGLASSKPQTRKTWATAFGNTVWKRTDASQTLSANVTKYMQGLFSVFDKIVDKPLLWKDGPLEAYILIASISGRIQQWPTVPPAVLDLLKKHKYPSTLLVSSPKPSFLLWDRIYTKATGAEEGLWLVRALTSLFQRESTASLEKSGAGYLCAQALIWIITSHPEHTVRRAAYQDTSAIAASEPQKLTVFAKQALTQWLLDLEHKAKDSTAMIGYHAENYNKDVASYRLASVLNTILSFDKDLDADIKEKELLDFMILAHHPYIASPTDKYNWISLMQRVNINPGALVANHIETIRDILRKAMSDEVQSELFYQAALASISTLVFISPSLIPLFMEMISDDLNPALVNGIGSLECQIWKTPEGECCVDVIKKKTTTEHRNKKGFKDQQWEEELRAELAKKKGLVQKLTKEEQAAVDAQLKKESEIRDKVQKVHDQLALGLRMIGALIRGNTHAMEEYVVELVRILLLIGKTNAGMMVGESIVDTYLELGACVSENVYTIRAAIALATLRANGVQPIPARWLDEPLGALIARVLYRLRFITEAQPLPPATFAYIFPVLYQVIQQGGIDCGKSDDGVETAMEQVVMSVDVIGFHCQQGESTVMPRQEMIASLLHAIKEYPQVSKNAKLSLVALSETMVDSVTLEETNTLLQGLLSEESLVRSAALQGLEYLDLTDIDYSPELWLACHDDQNADLANTLWNDNAMDVEEDYRDVLLDYAVSDSSYVRNAVSKAMADAIAMYPNTVADTLAAIYALYKKKAAPLDPEYDQYGMVIPETLNRRDPWEARAGLALMLQAMAPQMQFDNVRGFCQFLIKDEALGDRDETVRKKMLDAGLAAVNAYGHEGKQDLLATFEAYLNQQAVDSETHDYIRQAVIILYGGAAGFLDSGDSKVTMAVDKMIATLDTPSEVVQSAVADCLPPLIKKIKEEVPQICEGLLKKLFTGEKYAQRRGAAYGLAGVVKGRGITALKECNIMTSLKEAVDNKRAYQSRQGALFAFETLSSTLGRLFEPYIIQIIPLLLVCFGDANTDVREACSDTARVIMSKISGHCVKLILPSILEGLDDRQWRTKKASVELLGATAYCAPKQLSVSLPNIIPRITEVLADTHAQVQAAARRSLQLFGEVISNPEIQGLVPVLLEALSDPNRKTKAALTALLQTSFVHYIDPPSLALVMPILERGLRERGTEIKTKSAQIVGNMASLTDQKDLVPYLPILMPGIKEVLADPVPEARGTAAKALGSFVEKLGEDNFPGLVMELLDKLKTDTGNVDRQGAAQGLSEVLAGLGLERLDGLLPEILASADSPRAYVREGFISLLIYLPATFGPRFQPYLGRIIPPILMGLADESEFVRDASLRAGRMIVTNYATKAVDLLLPELEKGLFDANWRIRQSSVQLVGDLLFRITGIVNPNKGLEALGNFDELKDEDADDSYGVGENKSKQLLDVLGKDRRDRILSALYIVRQDFSGIVRQASLRVWKVLVSNTPRTLKDILPAMMLMVIRNLSSDNDEKSAVAGRTLAELVVKLGEGVLPEILPILEEGMGSNDEETRQGVTSAFSIVMETAGKVQVLDFADQIIPVVKKALCDSSSEVREAAAQAFDTLHQNVGARAIDEILPSLLNQLQSSDEGSVYALAALKEIMAVRANVVFPVLIPTLIATPMSAFNARALGSLVTVAGSALNRRLSVILSAIVESRMMETDEEVLEQLSTTTIALMKSIEDEDGLATLISTLQEYARSESWEKRAVACDITASFYSETDLDGSDYVQEWIEILVPLLDDSASAVVKPAWNALSAVTKSMPKDEYEALVPVTRHAVHIVGVRGCDVAGFCLPKGISAVLPIFLQGLMYGSTENRELSALGIGDLIERTSSDALKPFVTQITGPLIRIVGDRYPPQVKSAILQTLGLLLGKVPMHLKPFLPQLQRTFVKSLSDASSDDVRSNAASALGVLITLQPRVDPLVTELVSGIRASEAEVKEAMMEALENVVSKTQAALSDNSKKGIQSIIEEGLAKDATSGMKESATRLQAILK